MALGVSLCVVPYNHGPDQFKNIQMVNNKKVEMRCLLYNLMFKQTQESNLAL